MHPDDKPPRFISGIHLPVHLFHQRPRNGKSKPGRIFGIFHGIEAVKKPADFHFTERCRCIGKGDGAVFGKRDGKIPVAVFYGIV